MVRCVLGYLCKFPEFLQTCQQVLESGESKDGNYTLDLDGSNSLQAFTAYCSLSSSVFDGFTIIQTHIQHGGNTTGNGDMQRFYIDFRGVNTSHVKELVKLSKACYQYVGFTSQTLPGSCSAIGSRCIVYISVFDEDGRNVSYPIERFQEETCSTNQSRYDCLLEFTIHKLTRRDLSEDSPFVPIQQVDAPTGIEVVTGPLVCYGGRYTFLLCKM